MHTTETPRPTASEPGLETEPTPLNTTGASPSVVRLGADEAKRTFPPRRRLGDEQEREVTRLYAETATPVAQIGQQFGIGESSVYRIAQRNGAALRGRTAAVSAMPVVPPAEVAAPVVAPAAVETPPAPAASVGVPIEVGAEKVATVVAPAVRRTRVPRAKATPVPPVPPVAAVAPVAAPAPVVPAVTRRRGPGRKRAALAPAAARPTAPVVPQPVAPVAAKSPAATRLNPAPAAALRFRIRFNAETVVVAVDVRDALRQVDSLGATDVQAITREA